MPVPRLLSVISHFLRYVVKDVKDLNISNFIQQMKACLEVWKNEGKEFSDIRVALDWIKYNFGFFSVQYAKELTKIKREKEESTEETPSCTYKI